ncbi:MAG TPA: SMI1/KNR4 family protein [Chloroflexia bacterium]|nr:SMI1/KNR4 family protein [Chloroflexia bacterium]
MRSIEYETYQPPATEDEVLKLEKHLGISLPLGYRNYLLTYNGGRVEPCVFPIANCPRDTHGILSWFFGINGGEYYDLMDNVRTYSDRVPSNLLPIGEDPGGNLICLSVLGSDKGTVYFWEREWEVLEGEAPDYSNVYLIAEDFDGLLNSLAEWPDIPTTS